MVIFEPLEGGQLKGKVINRVKFLKTRGLAVDMLGGDRQLLPNGGSSTRRTWAGWSRTRGSAAFCLTDGEVLVKKYLAFLCRS